MLVVFFFLVSPLSLQAATYYIDAVAGDDGNTGLSEGDAWQTIDKVASAPKSPGDFFLFKREQTFTRNINFSIDGGTLGNPITYGTYGNSDDAKPIIQINNTNGFYFSANASYITIQDLNIKSTGYAVNLYNGTHSGIILKNLTIEESGSGIFAPSSAITTGMVVENIEIKNMTWSSSRGIWHNGKSINDTFTNIDITVTDSSGIDFNYTGFDTDNLIGATFENISVTGSSSSANGIRLKNASDVTIKNATTTGFSNGVLIDGTVKHNIDIEGLYSADNNTGLKVQTTSTSSIAVSNSTFADNNDYGIYVENNGNTMYLDKLTTENNGTNDLLVKPSNTVTLTNSKIGNIVNNGYLNILNNIIKTQNAWAPVQYFGSSATGTIAHNTILASGNTFGIDINLGAFATVYNNIVTDYSFTGIRFLDSFGDGGITESHNLIYSTSGGPNSGFTRSPDTIVGVDPKLNPDFSLQSGSPAIDAGMVLVGHTADFLGNPIIGLPDIGAFEWQGEKITNHSSGIVSQSIYNEIALSIGSSLTLSPSLPGVTGGVSSGELPFNIKTNNPLGYQVDLKFSEAVPFRHLFSPSFYILNYVPQVVGVPDYNLVTPSKSHGFAYSVFSDNATQLFRHSGSTCNTGSSNTLGKCWFNRVDASVPTTIIERSGATGAEGATSTLQFRVVVDENATPMLLEGEYQATVTVTVLPL